MPRYYFHLRDGVDLLLDADGRELEDADAAAREALFEARALIAEDAREGFIPLGRPLDVENVHGNLICRVPFADAVRIVLPK